MSESVQDQDYFTSTLAVIHTWVERISGLRLSLLIFLADWLNDKLVFGEWLQYLAHLRLSLIRPTQKTNDPRSTIPKFTYHLHTHNKTTLETSVSASVYCVLTCRFVSDASVHQTALSNQCQSNFVHNERKLVLSASSAESIPLIVP